VTGWCFATGLPTSTRVPSLPFKNGHPAGRAVRPEHAAQGRLSSWFVCRAPVNGSSLTTSRMTHSLGRPVTGGPYLLKPRPPREASATTNFHTRNGFIWETISSRCYKGLLVFFEPSKPLYCKSLVNCALCAPGRSHNEPPRVCRRPFGFSHAAIADGSMAA